PVDRGDQRRQVRGDGRRDEDDPVAEVRVEADELDLIAGCGARGVRDAERSEPLDREVRPEVDRVDGRPAGGEAGGQALRAEPRWASVVSRGTGGAGGAPSTETVRTSAPSSLRPVAAS